MSETTNSDPSGEAPRETGDTAEQRDAEVQREAEERDSAEAQGGVEVQAGVLARLPRTRPQRASPRRARARATASTRDDAAPRRARARATASTRDDAAGAEAAARSANGARAGAVGGTADGARKVGGAANGARKVGGAANGARKAPRKSARTGARKPPPVKTTRAGAGRAAEPVPPQGYESDDDSLRGPVRPPGGAELVTSAAELAGEMAKTGVSAGARLVRDLLSRLPS